MCSKCWLELLKNSKAFLGLTCVSSVCLNSLDLKNRSSCVNIAERLGNCSKKVNANIQDNLDTVVNGIKNLNMFLNVGLNFQKVCKRLYMLTTD